MNGMDQPSQATQEAEVGKLKITWAHKPKTSLDNRVKPQK